MIATSPVTFSDTRQPAPTFTFGTYKFAIPFAGSSQLRDPGLFTNQAVTPAQAGGTILVATAANDPFFNDVVARLTDGVPQRPSNVFEWKPNSTLITGHGALTEAAFFGLPEGTVDFQGSTIRAIGLQVNFVDQFFYTSRTSSQLAGQYRFQATLLLSDTETIAAPDVPVAIAMAGRENAFRVMPGEDLVIDASKSLGEITLYEWDLDADGTYDLSAADARLTLTPAQYEPYLATRFSRPLGLRVTDAAGNISTGYSDSVLLVPEPSTAVLVLGAAGVIALTRGRRRALS